MTSGSFIFTVCQHGAENALKKEIAREHPELRFAYSRPGFLTFKANAPITPDFELRSVFARAYGISIDKRLATDGNNADKATHALSLLSGLPSATKLHVFEVDRCKPGEEPLGFVHGTWSKPAIEAIKQAAGTKVSVNERASDGDTVLDVIVVQENEWWFGTHKANANHSPYPGGQIPITLPPEAPSRAYLKLEEAIHWSNAPIKAGDTAVEIGSAPGGAVYALLQRGLYVVGIDPGRMDERILRSQRYSHFDCPVADVLREDLPRDVHWLLLDMNVKPGISLFAADRMASRMKESLLGVMLTVKLNTWKTADEIPDMLAHVRAMGMNVLRATQLPSNKQEIFIFGLMRKGISRLRQ